MSKIYSINLKMADISTKVSSFSGEILNSSPFKGFFLYLPFHFLFFSWLFLNLMGCNQTFDPIKERNINRYSMFGYLDASVDTQWVRITPLRHQLSQPPEKPAMNATLLDLNRDQSSVMNDSLFLYPDGFYVLNSWTTVNVEPDHSYQLIVESPVKGKSRVTVTTPKDFPVPEMSIPDVDLCYAVVTFREVDRLADLQYRWYVKVTRPGWEYYRYFSANYRNQVRQTVPGEYRLVFDLRGARNGIEGAMTLFAKNTTFEVLRKELFVASGGAEWISYEELRSADDLTYALPEVYANIENGVGYVFGIVSKSIPDTFYCSDV